MSTCVSLALFLEERLNALGKVIACDLERPYAGSAGDVLWLMKWLDRLRAGRDSLSDAASHGGKKVTLRLENSRPQANLRGYLRRPSDVCSCVLGAVRHHEVYEYGSFLEPVRLLHFAVGQLRRREWVKYFNLAN
jgi:hypothetical protein